MSRSILHPDHLTAIPCSVHELDALLNHLVATAQNDDELHKWMRMKAAVKRRLVATPPELLDAVARAELSALQESL
jgi:hypothetical protein